jgi:hypothetical protein
MSCPHEVHLLRPRLWELGGRSSMSEMSEGDLGQLSDPYPNIELLPLILPETETGEVFLLFEDSVVYINSKVRRYDIYIIHFKIERKTDLIPYTLLRYPTLIY